jgi:hypothetical protein
MKRRLLAALLLAGVTGCATACGPGETRVPAAARAAALLASVETRAAVSARAALLSERDSSLEVSLLRVSESDFPAYDSPEALAADRPIVVAGVIDGWQQGPATQTYANGPLEYRVVLRVRVTESLKGRWDTESLACIALDQGGVTREDSLLADRWKPARSVADFEKAMPTGTRVLAYPRELPPEALTGAVRLPGDELPRSARLMVLPPQGLVLEDPARRSDGRAALIGGREPLTGGWLEPKDMDELVARLKRHGFTG